MDCQTFDSSLLDALYDELDTPVSTAMDEHAAGCAACEGRLARLKRTRELIRPLLEVSLPEGLEAKILAAVETEEAAKPSTASPVVALDDHRAARAVAAAEPRADAKRGGVLAFLARPQFAIAAAFLLVLGATALFTTQSRNAPSASSRADQAPAAANAPAPADEPAPPPPSVAAEESKGAASAVALNTPPPSTPAFAPRPGPRTAGGLDQDDGVARPSHAKPVTPPSGGAADSGFVAAKALYDAGKYAEALPKLDALAGSHPEAELLAARAAAKSRGCTAAAARYDRFVHANNGTERGSRAALEIARCLKGAGQNAAARTRYQALATDNYVSQEANAELAALGAPQSTPQAAKPPPAKPQATGTASAHPIDNAQNVSPAR